MPAEPRRDGDTRADRAITITIGADGRVLFHDLPEELLPVADLLRPGDRTLRDRRDASKLLKKGRP